MPLRAPVNELQSFIDARRETVEVAGRAVPTVASGLIETERALLQSRGLLSSTGKITPWVIAKEQFDTPEKLLTQELWDSIYGVPKGDVTIEHIQRLQLLNNSAVVRIPIMDPRRSEQVSAQCPIWREIGRARPLVAW